MRKKKMLYQHNVPHATHRSPELQFRGFFNLMYCDFSKHDLIFSIHRKDKALRPPPWAQGEGRETVSV